MYVQLSSKCTFFFKFIFTGVWVGMVGLMTLGNFVGVPASEKIDELFLITFWIAAAVVWWMFGRLKKIERQGDTLRISNYSARSRSP